MSNDDGYLLDNRAAQAGSRFDALAATFNRWTFDHLDRLGLGEGWHCWEVGAGGPSIPQWLSERVGTSGSVLATDIDVSWMPIARPYEVRQHDVVRDGPPIGPFDLIHARLVLVHLPERLDVLTRMAGALRPGGWLVVEDFDLAANDRACLDEAAPGAARANRVRAGFLTLLVQRGVDRSYARSLPRRLRGLDLADVGAEAYLPLAVPSTRALDAANVEQTRDGLISVGVDQRDIDEHLAELAAGTVDVTTSLLVTAWGRRPAA